MSFHKRRSWLFFLSMMIKRNKPEYLYIHVPFCARICYYCDFVHQVYQSNAAEKWLDAIEKELDWVNPRKDLKTIYIGGGTPTALSADQLDRLLCLFDDYGSALSEYTIEINPETIDPEKADILKSHGINRVSMGFQTSDQTLLKKMNRGHDLAACRKAVNLLRERNISNISLDLMYSLPGQSMDILKQSIVDALSLEPAHLSLYSLTVEENTVFGKKGIKSCEEELEADMYEYICGILPKYGFEQYEISNFAKDGHESIHNQAYWNYDDFIGIGAGASGKEGLIRYDHTRILKEYIDNPLDRKEIVNTTEDAMFEMVMMGMRLKKGMQKEKFAKTFGVSFSSVYGKIEKKLIAKGLVQKNDQYLQASRRGYEILNDVLIEFLPNEVCNG